jgi:hypothetical protein
VPPFKSEHKDGNIKDRCLLCSEPVYESEVGVYFHGLWVHASCYRRESNFQDAETPQPE